MRKHIAEASPPPRASEIRFFSVCLKFGFLKNKNMPKKNTKQEINSQAQIEIYIYARQMLRVDG